MALEVLEVALEMIEALRPLVARLRLSNRDLADQVQRAASSVAMNIAEGAGRAGKDRPHHYRVSAGGNLEVAAGLRVAVAWGNLEAAEVQHALGLGRRVGAMLWRMTH
ncbi:MAG: four helix bundle protein [Deltaproteobacteria bacterium]|nr:four helix bundle protein [Deltaproteobacteria bacterium]